VPSIETDVKGSPGTCRETATWLGTFAQAAHEAATAVRSARSESEPPAWSGSAGDAFRSAINGVDGDTDQLANHATEAARALDDFADSIDAVAQQMAHAREIAQAGGLTVSGTVILSPKPAGPPPMVFLPCTASDPAGAQIQADANSAAGKLHQQAVNTYNAQATVFNEAKAIVTSARNVERNAHDALNRAMTDTEHRTTILKTVGSAVAHALLDAIKGTQEGADKLSEEAEKFREAAATYQKLADGHLTTLTQADLAFLNRLGHESDQLAALNEVKATELEKWISLVPKDVRDFVAKNPAQLVKNSDSYIKYLKPYLRGMPYVGSVMTIGTEAYDALSGEKSLGQAAADGGAEIAGSAAGTAAGEAAGTAAGGWVAGMWAGAEAGFIGGTAEPGLGNIVGGIAGGIAGGIIGAEGAKKVLHFFTG
jgi:uncharacterized protein YukE